MNREPKYPTGTKFNTRHKVPRTMQVVDILKTYDSKGELVEIRYVATYQFLGQTVTDRDVVETTIAMGII